MRNEAKPLEPKILVAAKSSRVGAREAADRDRGMRRAAARKQPLKRPEYKARRAHRRQKAAQEKIR